MASSLLILGTVSTITALGGFVLGLYAGLNTNDDT